MTPETNDVIELTQALICFDTTNPPGNETPCIELLEARLRESGFETVTCPYDGGEGVGNRSQLVARLRGSGERPGLLFSGHVDVVPVGEAPWSVPPFAGEIRDGRLYGRGSCDMKGGVAALVEAAGAVARGGEPLQGDLVVAVTADEERNCLGADALVEEPLFAGLGAAIVAEPTALEVYIAEKGAFWVRLEFHGKTAHASMPDEGANAVAAAADFAVRWERAYETTTPAHPLLGTPTLSLGILRGGNKTNVVPDYCRLELDMRTVPGLEHADLERRLRDILAAVSRDSPGVRAEITVLSNRAPVSAPAESEIVAAVGAAAREVAGVHPTRRGVPYCTEACVWAPKLGLSFVICGPGAPTMCHQPDEFVPVKQLTQAVCIYTRAAERLLG